MVDISKPYLRKIIYNKEKAEGFPHNLPVMQNIESIEFKTPVTYIIGENGAGKSTLLEAIAVAMGLNAEGGNKNTVFKTAETHTNLHKYFKTIKGAYRPTDWYFLRAESFYNVASFMDEAGYLFEYGNKSLHKQSHGESFMAVLSNKLKGNGFYILDEPEAALSPQRQLSALQEIDRLVKANSQLIISTHSPILMAYPNSTILQVTPNGLVEVNYEDTEHYQVTKIFLNRTSKMLDDLLI